MQSEPSSTSHCLIWEKVDRLNDVSGSYKFTDVLVQFVQRMTVRRLFNISYVIDDICV